MRTGEGGLRAWRAAELDERPGARAARLEDAERRSSARVIQVGGATTTRVDHVRCPICLGDRFLQAGPLGVTPATAYDMTRAADLGRRVGRCYCCAGYGVVTQRESDLVTIEVMRRDLLVYRALGKSF